MQKKIRRNRLQEVLLEKSKTNQHRKQHRRLVKALVLWAVSIAHGVDPVTQSRSQQLALIFILWVVAADLPTPDPFLHFFFLLSILSSETSTKAEWVLCYCLILGLDDLFGPHLSRVQLRNCKSCYECWVAWCFTVVHLISDKGQILSIATTANSHHQSWRAQYLKPQEKLGGICWNGWFLKHQKDNLDHFTILSESFKREMEEYARRIWELS